MDRNDSFYPPETGALLEISGRGGMSGKKGGRAGRAAGAVFASGGEYHGWRVSFSASEIPDGHFRN